MSKLSLLYGWEVKGRTQIITFFAMLFIYTFLLRLSLQEKIGTPPTSNFAVREVVGQVLFSFLPNVYLLLVPISAMLATLSFSYEIDTGVARFILSLPMKRTTVFVGKYLSTVTVLVLPFMISFISLLIYLDPATFNYVTFLLSSQAVMIGLGLCILEILFILSVAILSAVVTNQTMIAPLPSIIVLLFLYYIGALLPKPGSYIPPFSLRRALPFAGSIPSFLEPVLILLFVTVVVSVVAIYVYLHKEVP